jgi:hypothetical protein
MDGETPTDSLSHSGCSENELPIKIIKTMDHSLCVTQFNSLHFGVV